MIKKLLTHPFVLFPLMSCIFFWPLSLQFFSLKNDALTYYYPIRTLISDALNNGELPLWTPYINMGYPLHADLQSGAWNPVIWLFSLTTGYSLAAFHWEFIFYVAIAGIGFYYLCRQHGATKHIAVILAFSYQFSGFIIDSAQFFTCISSAGYLPFIVLFFSRAMQLHRWQDAIYSGVFLSLLFTGGYPSIFVVTCYLLLAYAIFSLITAKQKGNYLRITAPLWMLTFVTFSLLSLPAMLSFEDYLPMIQRGKGLSLAAAEENPMHPSSIVSLFAPYANTGNLRAVGSSILMQSIYFGLVPLLLLFSSIGRRNVNWNRSTVLILTGGLVFLSVAMGGFFITHQLSYRLLPLMDAFRHPGLFRLFFICLLLLGINNYARGQAHAQVDPPRKTAAVLFFIMLACGVVLALKHGLPNLQSVSAKLLPATLKALSFSDRYLIHLPFSLCVLWFAYLALQKRKKWYWLCILAAADMFVFVQLCLPVTVTGARSMIAVEQHLGRNRERFPLPGHTSIAENSLNSIDELLITGSKIPFLKKPGRNAYFITPGNLQLQDSFYASPIRESVFAHSMLYVADSFANYSNSHKRSEVEEKTVYLNRAVIHADKSRRPIVNIYALSANEIKATIDSSSAGKIILLQNFYPGWKAFADGKAKTIEPVNITYMGVNISAGTKELKFVYKPLKIIYSFYMAAIVWLLFVAMIIADLFSLRRAGKHQTEISRTGST